MLERLTDTVDLAKIESRFINLISRTFLKGALGKPGPKLKNSVRQAFSSKTYEVQLDKIIDDIYLVSVGYTDDRVKEVSTGKPLGSSRTSTGELISKVFSLGGSMRSSGSARVWGAAAKKPLPITVEAVRATKGMAKEVSESIIRILEDEGIYTKHPYQLEKRIRDLWGGSKYRAARFARTFTADVATNTAVHRYKEQGISLLQFYAEIDDRTTEQCKALHGTVIPTNSKDIQKYRPPLHMHCRSDLLPVPLGYKVDPDLLIENRDFTKQLDQDFSPLDVVDQDIVTNAFDAIDDFNDNYRVDKFILDEDVELRLMRLNIKIETVEPQEKEPGIEPEKPDPQKIRDEEFGNYEDQIRNRKTEKCYLLDENGKVILSKTGTKSRISYTQEEANLLPGNYFTHNHPSGGSFSDTDIITSCHYKLKEMRACGKYRTFIMKMKDGNAFYPELWDEKISKRYAQIQDSVVKSYIQKILKGQIDMNTANRLISHDIWVQVSTEFSELDYTYLDVPGEDWNP